MIDTCGDKLRKAEAENEQLRGLLREWTTCSDITDYDSSLCWGCGVQKKTEPHSEGCLLGRSIDALK